jgi:hypothetical protein
MELATLARESEELLGVRPRGERQEHPGTTLGRVRYSFIGSDQPTSEVRARDCLTPELELRGGQGVALAVVGRLAAPSAPANR